MYLGAKNNKNNVNTNTAFNEAASDIAKGIHKTSGLLTKLTNLVKRQGLFDDPTEEINSLIHRIKQDLDEMNNKCDTAQQFIESKKSLFGIGTKNQSSEHNSKVVGHLKSDLLNTTKDFKNILELRSSKMKDQQVRKVELIGKGTFLSPLKSLPSTTQSRGPGSSTLKETGKVESSSEASTASTETSSLVVRKSQAVGYPSPYANFHDGSSSSGSRFKPFEQDQIHSQQQFLLAPIAETQYYDQREKAVSEVEKTIGELGTLFKRLATMISEQQELVERIDEDVENSISNADKAHAMLLKTYEKASSNRGLYLKIFGILAVFILFFVLFLL